MRDRGRLRRNRRADSNKSALAWGVVGLALGVGAALLVRRYVADRLFHPIEADPLTGGRTLARFQIDAEHALACASEGEFAVLAFDISRFKDFNDAYGCAEGDRLLLALDQLLATYARPGEFHAHVAGDRFVALVRWKGVDDFAGRIAQLDKDINRLSMLQERDCRVICFGGIAVHSGVFAGRSTVAELIDQARCAREHVKEAPRSTVALYVQEMKEKDASCRALQNAGVDALARGEFVSYYQPKVELATGKLVGFEALVRWRTSEGKMLFPADFIGPFEKNGFITEIDVSMFRQACSLLRERLDAGLPVVPVACNFSRINLLNKDFVATLVEVAQRYEVPCDLLELELTESVVLGDASRTAAVGKELRSHGFKLAIDDFGSGYSSLSMLQDLQADVLKIDRSLLTGSEDGACGRVILESIVAMADKLDLSVVVEGVETADQVRWLTSLHPCIVGQGYLFSPPVDKRSAEALLAEGLFAL